LHESSLNRKRATGDTGPGDTLEELSRRLREKSPNGHRIDTFDDAALVENLHLANAYYDRNLPGTPESERRFLHRLFSLAKRVVRKAVSWYMDPALDEQRLFNAYVTRSVNEMKMYLDHLQINEDILSTVMHRDLALFRANIMFLNRYLERRMIDFETEVAMSRGELPPGLRSLEVAPANAPADNGDLMAALDVLTLEQRVHGSPRMVMDRQRVYLEHFRGCERVLALGCGRGEFLQLLAGEKMEAKGVEMNSALVNYCRDHDLDVVRADPLDYLESVEDASVDGVMLSRFAGHQPPGRLMRMLKACRQKLRDGGVLLIETPNPFSLYAVASYALEDYNRIHPLHPETLKLLCLTYGFLDPDVLFLNPLPPEEHLEEVSAAGSGALLGPREQELFHRVNQNFQKINRIMFSHRDYALLTRRGGRDDS